MWWGVGSTADQSGAWPWVHRVAVACAMLSGSGVSGDRLATPTSPGLTRRPSRVSVGSGPTSNATAPPTPGPPCASAAPSAAA